MANIKICLLLLSLTKEQIKIIYKEYLHRYSTNENAEETLKEFFEIEDYDEINLNKGMSAAKFRKKVTSTVLWLLNFKLRILCFKVTLFELEDNLFLYFERIIPMKDSEEYEISIADKNQEEISIQEDSKNRYLLRVGFWKKLPDKMKQKSDMFRNISPSKDNWIGTGTGISSVRALSPESRKRRK